MAVLPYSLERTVAPTEEPLTVDQAAKQLEISGNDHDEHLLELIIAAREQFEHDTDRALITQTWVQRNDSPPRWRAHRHDDPLIDEWFSWHRPSSRWYLRLGVRPVISLTSITYLDTSGVSQTMSSSDYELDTKREIPVVWLAYNASWPNMREIQNTMTTTFVAGYGERTAVPQLIKQAMLLQVAAWFECRAMSKQEIDSYDRIVARYARPSYP